MPILPTDEELEKMAPWIDWREEPIKITTPRITGLVCRYCLARYGISAMNIEKSPFLFKTMGEFRGHIKTQHSKHKKRATTQ